MVNAIEEAADAIGDVIRPVADAAAALIAALDSSSKYCSA